jgi:hypothetical protein
MTQTNFDTWAGTWQTPAVSAKSTYNYLSLGGNGFFVDELRMGTTSDDVATLVPVFYQNGRSLNR